jgi:hypothetical protein
MSEKEIPATRAGRVVSGDSVLDLSHLTQPDQLAAISRIERVAVVIVPESLAAAYAAIPTAHVASTVYVPGGANVSVQTGSLVIGGGRHRPPARGRRRRDLPADRRLGRRPLGRACGPGV